MNCFQNKIDSELKDAQFDENAVKAVLERTEKKRTTLSRFLNRELELRISPVPLVIASLLFMLTCSFGYLNISVDAKEIEETRLELIQNESVKTIGEGGASWAE